MIHTFISTDYQMLKRRFTSITRGIHDFGELGSHMGHGKTAVGHEIASDFSVRFPISHMGISAATFKAAEPMVRKKAFGMKTPYS